MKKLLLILLCVPLLFISCNKDEDTNGNKTNIDIDNNGRYQVIERKEIQWYGVNRQRDLHDHSYYLLDTKTGEIKLIDFP